MNMKPFPFQKQVVRQAETFHGRALISADMGLGKTAMSLWYAARNDATPAVIVCPASLKWQWQTEAMKVLGWRVSVCEGMKPHARKLDDRITIINYDILNAWLPLLKAMRPVLVVLDECQYLAHPQTIRTKAVRQLCKGVPHVLALSGTPLVNRPIELFPVLNILRPGTFSSRFSFGLEYCGGRRGRWGWEFKGATKTGELHELLTSKVMIRRRKQDVLKELPNKIRQVVPVDIKKPSEYRKAQDDFIGWLQTQDPAAAVRAKRAQAVTRAGYLLRLAARLKCKAVVDWVNEWLNDTDEKLVLFAVHTKMIEALHRRIEAKSVVVDGSHSGKDRKHAVEQFQRDSRTRLLIGNIQAAGVGLNLTQASTVAFAELPWQPGAVTQAEDRCHRIGQDQPVWIHYLVAHGTVEEGRCRIIQAKQNVLSSVLDGGRVEGDLDVFEEFIQQLEVKR